MLTRLPFVLPVATLVLLFPATVMAQDGRTTVIFVEPARAVEGNEPEVYQLVADSARRTMLDGWMANESARLALDLYTRAWALTPQGRRGEPATYYIALVPGGNHAAVGLRLLDDQHSDPRTPVSFIKLSPQEWAFETTLLHETGHVILSLLNGGAEIPKRTIASFSHATAALTDRGTAFDEGFAIHLETLAAHFTSDAFLKDRYHHRRFRFGAQDRLGEYYRHAGDLMSFSQTIARYHEVKENNFAFAPAYTGPDYLRVQLEKSRDFASLRNANQLLQSEGFHASFFFGLLMRGSTPPSPEVLQKRQEQMLAVMAEMLGSGSENADNPLLFLFVEAYLRTFPGEASDVVDVLLDLSHGVFVDQEAATLWRQYYMAALRLEPADPLAEKIEAARKRWRAAVMGDSRVLYTLLGPQIRAEAVGPTVTIAAFGEDNPVSFDVNTVEHGVMRLVPGIGPGEVEAWRRARDTTPFVDSEDFRQRAGLRRATLTRLRFH